MFDQPVGVSAEDVESCADGLVDSIRELRLGGARRWRRCMLGNATNGRVAMAGSIISGAAVVLACIGAVLVFSDLLD